MRTHRNRKLAQTRAKRKAMRLSVGVDLHKTQFTVYWRREGDSEGRFAQYLTNEEGYCCFEEELEKAFEQGHEVAVVVECTGNARYFKNRVEKCGVRVVIVNTLKFKVVNESVRKTDRHDAATLAEFLEKGMLPEARLCSQHSEELRRMLKERSSLVRTIVSVKNQIHGLLLCLGIESTRAGLQSQKEHRLIQDILAAHGYVGGAVDPLFDILDRLDEEVKKLGKLIAELTADNPVVQLIRTIPGAGVINAATLRAYIDDISRFTTPRQLAAFASVVP